MRRHSTSKMFYSSPEFRALREALELNGILSEDLADVAFDKALNRFRESLKYVQRTANQIKFRRLQERWNPKSDYSDQEV